MKPSVREALRDRAWEAAWCLACEAKPPEPLVDYDAFQDEMIVRFWCHGSTATRRFDTSAVEFGYRRGIAALEEWAAALFKEDASPDMRELLRYNREPGWLAS